MSDTTPFVSPVYSLLDRPGKSALVVYTSLCNWSCYGCHNMAILRSKPQPHITRTKFASYLSNPLVQCVVVSGGEPTLLKDELFEELAWIRETYPQMHISLDTNGSNPDMLKKLIEQKLIDSIAMDVKLNWFEKETWVSWAKKLLGCHVVSRDDILESMRITASLPGSLFRTVKYPLFETADTYLADLKDSLDHEYPDIPYYQNRYVDMSVGSLHNPALIAVV